MLKRVLKEANEFYAKAVAISPEYAKEVVVDAGKELDTPTPGDQADVQILMGRAVKALNHKSMDHFFATMIALDKLIRKFKHESFDEEFYDFAEDQELWDWVNTLYKKNLTDYDWALASLVRDNLSYLMSKPRLFK
ncbi:MAG TPA: hypothetical protein VM577_05285 [Anaerovoracaceae bacterium]|nr:hypothetical protein [Anaerovoracaceae bacterium]